MILFQKRIGIRNWKHKIIWGREGGGQDLNIYKYPSHTALRIQRVLYSDCVWENKTA